MHITKTKVSSILLIPIITILMVQSTFGFSGEFIGPDGKETPRLRSLRALAQQAFSEETRDFLKELEKIETLCFNSPTNDRKKFFIGEREKWAKPFLRWFYSDLENKLPDQKVFDHAIVPVMNKMGSPVTQVEALRKSLKMGFHFKNIWFLLGNHEIACKVQIQINQISRELQGTHRSFLFTKEKSLDFESLNIIGIQDEDSVVVVQSERPLFTLKTNKPHELDYKGRVAETLHRPVEWIYIPIRDWREDKHAYSLLEDEVSTARWAEWRLKELLHKILFEYKQWNSLMDDTQYRVSVWAERKDHLYYCRDQIRRSDSEETVGEQEPWYEELDGNELDSIDHRGEEIAKNQT